MGMVSAAASEPRRLRPLTLAAILLAPWALAACATLSPEQCRVVDWREQGFRDGRNGAADNPVLGGRLHLSSRNWGNTHAVMLDHMLAAMERDRERFITALGDRQYRRMLLRMQAARAAAPMSWILCLRSLLV